MVINIKRTEISMKLDEVDLLILKELTKDGRASFREIARNTSLSTPTVSSRFNRMLKAGLIRKFVPVIDRDAVGGTGILALVTLRVPAMRTSEVASVLEKLRPVYEVMITTGRDNLIVKLQLESTSALQNFITSSDFKKLNVEVVGTQIITKTVKEEHPSPIVRNAVLKLRCDYCRGEITGARSYSIKVASSRYYFCCKTCRRSYLEKHQRAINKLNAEGS